MSWAQGEIMRTRDEVTIIVVCLVTLAGWRIEVIFDSSDPGPC